MKKILLLAFLGATVLAQAQKCNYEVDQVDKFDGDLERITSPVILAKNVERKKNFSLRKVQAQLKNYDGEYLFALKFPVTSIIAPTFTDDKEESRVILLLENGKKMTLPLAKLMDNNKNKFDLRYGTDFALTPKDIAILKEQKITDMRVALKANTFDVPVDKHAQERLRQSFHCVE